MYFADSDTLRAASTNEKSEQKLRVSKANKEYTEVNNCYYHVSLLPLGTIIPSLWSTFPFRFPLPMLFVVFLAADSVSSPTDNILYRTHTDTHNDSYLLEHLYPLWSIEMTLEWPRFPCSCYPNRRRRRRHHEERPNKK